MVYASAPAFVEAVENSLKDALPEYHNGGALYVYFPANDFVKSVQLAHWIGGPIGKQVTSNVHVDGMLNPDEDLGSGL